MVAHRQAPAGRALIDIEFARLAADFLHDLDAGRAGADNADPLAGEVDLLMRPFLRPEDLAPELADPFDLRILGDGQGARRHDAIGRLDDLAAFERGAPEFCLVIPHRALDPRVEEIIVAQLQLVGDEIGVSQDFRLCGELLGPAPFLLNLIGETVTVVDAHQVAARAGIAVPVPDAADVATGLDTKDVLAHFAKAIDGVHAAEASANYDDVHVSGGRVSCLGVHLDTSGLTFEMRVLKGRVATGGSHTAPLRLARAHHLRPPAL
ncbi:hypothetical protein OEG86_15040 [Hoeflea alexandrii]|nr:hypothetical protein [Hoeflea alexandrii]MCY0153342.1 hypothetical protein [Hoeflea alexandrii]